MCQWPCHCWLYSFLGTPGQGQCCYRNRWKLQVLVHRICSSFNPCFQAAPGSIQAPVPPSGHCPHPCTPGTLAGTIPGASSDVGPDPGGIFRLKPWTLDVIPTGPHLQSPTHTGDTCTVEYSQASVCVRPDVPLSLHGGSASLLSAAGTWSRSRAGPRDIREHQMPVASSAWGRTDAAGCG